MRENNVCVRVFCILVRITSVTGDNGDNCGTLSYSSLD